MEQRRSQGGGRLPNGTVVLQYLDDDNRCVAVVVDDRMADRLGEEDQRRLQQHQESGRFHILLVLGHFADYGDRWSIFSRDENFRFPRYIIAERRTATEADLSAEMRVLRKQKDEALSRGLTSGRLHSRIFSFNNGQLEVLGLVGLVDHYLVGGTAENVPGWISLRFEGDNKIFLDELAIACPCEQ